MADGLMALQMILLIGGAILIFICWITMIAGGSKLSTKWGLLIFLFSIVAIPAFALLHWPAARRSFIGYCLGMGCVFLAFGLLAAGDSTKDMQLAEQVRQLEGGGLGDLSTSEQAAIYNDAADNFYYDREYQQALPLAQKAFALEASHDNHRTLGRIYTELGDYERGVYHLERSLEGQYFVSGYTLEDLAKAHMGRRNIARAWELYKRACGTGLESACRRVYQTPTANR